MMTLDLAATAAAPHVRRSQACGCRRPATEGGKMMTLGTAALAIEAPKNFTD